MTQHSALSTQHSALSTQHSRLCVPALFGLLLGLLSVVPLLLLLVVPASAAASLPLLLLLGLPALGLGFVGLRLVNQSEGRLRGHWAAVAGMILGTVGTFGVLVLGLLANLFLQLRENAARLECQNNLRVIGQALNAYYGEHDQYPAATLPNAALPAEAYDQHFSWLAGILPYLELEQGKARLGRGTAPRPEHARLTYERIDFSKAWDAEESRAAVDTRLRWYLCPSNPHQALPGGPGLTDYVGIAGLGPDAAALPAGDSRAGFFGYDRRLTRDMMQQDKEGRGTSQTLVAAETTDDNGPWAQGGHATVRAVDSSQRPYAGRGRPFGGSHPRGFNLLLADGAVLFVNDDMDPDLLDALVPIRGEH
jgi:hypothetical protein